MQIESKDGKIRFFFQKEAKTPEEEESQKKAVLSAIEDIRKMKKTDWKLILIVCIFFSSALAFHYYAQKVEKTPEYIEQIQAENLEIEQDIKKQVLNSRAKEVGIKPIHLQNTNIKDYLNLYLQKNTTMWEFETNNQIIYDGADTIVKAVKLQNGNTVFSINNKQFYVKE